MSAARVQSTVSLGCADRLSQIRFDCRISRTPQFLKFSCFSSPFFCVMFALHVMLLSRHYPALF